MVLVKIKKKYAGERNTPTYKRVRDERERV